MYNKMNSHWALKIEHFSVYPSPVYSSLKEASISLNFMLITYVFSLFSTYGYIFEEEKPV